MFVVKLTCPLQQCKIEFYAAQRMLKEEGFDAQWLPEKRFINRAYKHAREDHTEWPILENRRICL